MAGFDINKLIMESIQDTLSDNSVIQESETEQEPEVTTENQNIEYEPNYGVVSALSVGLLVK